MPYFGPLFDGAIVAMTSLAGLVRATALNASQLLRTLNPMYHSLYPFEAVLKCTCRLLVQKREYMYTSVQRLYAHAHVRSYMYKITTSGITVYVDLV